MYSGAVRRPEASRLDLIDNVSRIYRSHGTKKWVDKNRCEHARPAT